jgi:hypothetical protein
MRRVDIIPRIALATSVLAGAVGVWYAWPGRLACEVLGITGGQKLAVTVLTDIVNWGLGLSVAIVGGYGSILLRLKKGPPLTRSDRMLAVSAIVCFSWSAYFASMWRELLAQALYIDCPKLIASPWMTRSFSNYTYFLLAGLLILVCMVGLLALRPTGSSS